MRRPLLQLLLVLTGLVAAVAVSHSTYLRTGIAVGAASECGSTTQPADSLCMSALVAGALHHGATSGDCPDCPPSNDCTTCSPASLLPFSADDFLTRAKAGEELELRDCPNPVKEHVVLAQRLGLTGTPMTITDSGEQLNGYVPTNDLVARLQAVKQANRNE